MTMAEESSAQGEISQLRAQVVEVAFFLVLRMHTKCLVSRGDTMYMPTTIEFNEMLAAIMGREFGICLWTSKVLTISETTRGVQANW